MINDPLVIAKKSKSFFNGLMQFLKQYSVIGLAIGVIIGQASKDVIDAFVKGFFTPLIKVLMPANIAGLTFKINDQIFDISIIINTILTFIIVMFFLYFIIKFILKNDELLNKK